MCSTYRNQPYKLPFYDERETEKARRILIYGQNLKINHSSFLARVARFLLPPAQAA
jgi:hypothetical protein